MHPTSKIVRYSIAVLAAAAALALRIAMDPVLGIRIPYATFYAAVALSAVLGGVGPGIVTALLSMLAAVYYVVPPRGTLLIHGADNQLGFGLFAAVTAILITLAAMQRRANARLTQAVLARQQAEAAERAAREHFQITLSSIGDGLIATDAEARITFMNQVAADLTGWPVEEAHGRPLDSVFVIRNEENDAVVENPAMRAIRGGRVVGLANHTVLISKAGKRIPIDDSSAPILDAGRRVAGAVLVFRNVAGDKLRDAELRQRNRMIDLSHDAIITMDPERRISGWNRGAQEMYGWEEAEAIGHVTHELLRTRSAVPVAAVDQLLREQDRWEGELLHTCKDGREIVVDCRQVLLRDAAGATTGILEINRDTTERKRAEEDLRRVAAEAEEGRQTLEALMDHIPEGVTIADAPDGRVRMVSRHGLELAGRPAAVLENATAAEHPVTWGIYKPDGKTLALPEELPLTRAIANGETTTDEEWVIRRPDGAAVTVLCNAAPIRDKQGRITGGLIAWRDATQRKRLEEKLREAAKLESLGVLAGGIAHDFNNLLTGILGNASLLAEELPASGMARSCAEEICSAAEAAARLTQQMLAYSGRGRFVVQPIELSSYIRDTTALIRSSIERNVELDLDLADGLPLIEADVAQLQQLVMNLVINAAEAVGTAAGRVTVATRKQFVDELYLRALQAHEAVSPGLYVCLEVTDTGCGMDPETLARIFDPFFTTKFAGRGLGLAAVQGIVRGHKGAMKVYSSPGRGTTFLILLPVSGAAFETQPAVRRAASGTGAVLVVDDEELVRSAAAAALRHLGYEVLTAAGGRQALELLQSRDVNLSLVILDMTMPDLDGEEIMRELRKIKPGIRIVLSSGFSEAEALRRFRGYGLAGFLQKPYTVSKLAHCLRAAAGAGE